MPIPCPTPSWQTFSPALAQKKQNYTPCLRQATKSTPSECLLSLNACWLRIGRWRSAPLGDAQLLLMCIATSHAKKCWVRLVWSAIDTHISLKYGCSDDGISEEHECRLCRATFPAACGLCHLVWIGQGGGACCGARGRLAANLSLAVHHSFGVG